jgi:hypothetical protein
VRRLAILPGVLAALLAGTCAPRQAYDLIIRNGTVFDGSHLPPTRVDVAIDGDRIAAVGDLSGVPGAVIVDAAGQSVAPGFIDAASARGPSLLADPGGGRWIQQGITTTVVAWAPSPAERARLRQQGTSLNVAYLTPLSDANGPDATLEQALLAGSFGAWFQGGTLASPGGGLNPLSGSVQARGALVVAADGTVPPVETLEAALDAARAVRLGWVGVDLSRWQPGGDTRLIPLVAAARPVREQGLTPIFIVEPGRLPRVDDNDLWTFLGQPEVMVTTGDRDDAIRTWFDAYAGGRELFSNVDPVRRLTSLPALNYRLAERGIIREGWFADLVVFSEGPRIEHVIVNGVMVATPDGPTGARPGRILNGPSFPRPGS